MLFSCLRILQGVDIAQVCTPDLTAAEPIQTQEFFAGVVVVKCLMTSVSQQQLQVSPEAAEMIQCFVVSSPVHLFLTLVLLLQICAVEHLAILASSAHLDLVHLQGLAPAAQALVSNAQHYTWGLCTVAWQAPYAA